MRRGERVAGFERIFAAVWSVQMRKAALILIVQLRFKSKIFCLEICGAA
jgi:hypothetical protein